MINMYPLVAVRALVMSPLSCDEYFSPPGFLIVEQGLFLEPILLTIMFTGKVSCMLFIGGNVHVIFLVFLGTQ